MSDEHIEAYPLTDRNIRPPCQRWITTEAAARLLSVAKSTIYHFDRGVVRTRSRSNVGKGPRGAGTLFYAADIRALLQIRRECGVHLQHAARILSAIKRGALPFIRDEPADRVET